MNSKPTSSVDRVILSSPSLLNIDGRGASGAAVIDRTWIQLARTGNFVSKRYGKFSITKDDLSQMLQNFNEVTPKAPTELPVDFDHLSMDPKSPGDGVAAGWMKKLELRDEGNELWAEVEWTPRAAASIRNREYRFVSPSFVKDHVHKDGEKIGTTLLAAAITNHPFLEGMRSLTLYDFGAMGDIALDAPRNSAPTTHLAELGQRVSFVPDAERTPELTEEERAQTFVVKTMVGEGDDQFVRLSTSDGTEFGWFRTTQLAPGGAVAATSPTSSVKPNSQERTMSDTTAAAARFAAAVKRHEANGLATRAAFDLAQTEDLAGAEAYRLDGVSTGLAPEEPVPVLSLSGGVRENESFDAVVLRYAEEHRVPLRDAVRAVGAARPDLAAAR